MAGSNDDTPPHPDDALRAATDGLYAAFATLGFDPSMQRYPATVTDEDVAALGAAVRSVDASTLARFLVRVGSTWGGPDDLRRLLPRALELAADLQLPVDRGLLWAKMRWARWDEWAPTQVRATRAFLLAEWARLVRSDPRPAHVAHRWLRYAADGGEDVGPYLTEWSEALADEGILAHRRAATGHLVTLLVNSPLRPDLPLTVQDVFPQHPSTAALVTDWLVERRTAESLERSEVLLADTADVRRIGVASRRLERFRFAVTGRATSLPRRLPSD